MGTPCCFATQVYTVLAHSDTFGTSPQILLDAGYAPAAGVCCGSVQSSASAEPAVNARPPAAETDPYRQERRHELARDHRPDRR